MWNMLLATHVKYGLALVSVLILLTLLSKWTGSAASRGCHQKLRSLIRKAAYYSSKSETDNDTVKKVMHSSFALAYVNAARKLYSDSEIEAAADVKLSELLASVRRRHRFAIHQ